MLRLRGLCFKCLKSEQDFPASTLSCEITVTIKFRGRKESIPFIDGLQLFVKAN